MADIGCEVIAADVAEILNSAESAEAKGWLEEGVRKQKSYSGYDFDRFRSKYPDLASQIEKEWESGVNVKYAKQYDAFRAVVRANGYLPFSDSNGRRWYNMETGDVINMNSDAPWNIADKSNKGCVAEFQHTSGEPWSEEDEAEGRANARKEQASFLDRFIKRK